MMCWHDGDQPTLHAMGCLGKLLANPEQISLKCINALVAKEQPSPCPVLQPPPSSSPLPRQLHPPAGCCYNHAAQRGQMQPPVKAMGHLLELPTGKVWKPHALERLGNPLTPGGELSQHCGPEETQPPGERLSIPTSS